MFNKERYLTRGVSEKIPLEIQLIVWSMIEELEFEKDYLQVFKIKPLDKDLVEIEHKQEIPKYNNSMIIKNVGISSIVKLFVIDDGEYSTMLLAEEY